MIVYFDIIDVDVFNLKKTNEGDGHLLSKEDEEEDCLGWENSWHLSLWWEKKVFYDFKTKTRDLKGR